LSALVHDVETRFALLSLRILHPQQPRQLLQPKETLPDSRSASHNHLGASLILHSVFLIVTCGERPSDEKHSGEEYSDKGNQLLTNCRYSKCSMKVASPFAGDSLAQHLRNKSDADFDQALHRDELKATFGLAFEHAALVALKAGGKFDVRDVKQQSASSRVRDSLTLDRREERRLHNERVRNPLMLPKCCGSFLVPQRNFAVIDAMSVDGLFQTTLSTKRSHVRGSDGGEEVEVSLERDMHNGKEGRLTRQEAWLRLPALWCTMKIDDLPDWDGVRNGCVSLPLYYVVPKSGIERTSAFDHFSVSERDMPALVSVTLPVPNSSRRKTIKVTLVPKVLSVDCDYAYWLSGSASAPKAAATARTSESAAAVRQWQGAGKGRRVAGKGRRVAGKGRRVAGKGRRQSPRNAT